MSTKRNHQTLFRKNGFEMVSIYKQLFPSWVISGEVLYSVNPIYPGHYNTYPKIYELQKSCH